MDTIYKKMYAQLVGQVDETLQIIGNAVVFGNCDREMVKDIGNRLKDALLAAEELYVAEEE